MKQDEKFKVGDKVKINICDNICRNYEDKIGIIIMTDRIKKGYSDLWDYKVKFDDRFEYVFTPQEIKKAVIKNEQLLFSFMR